MRERAWPVIAVMAVLALLGPKLFAGWGEEPDWSSGLSVALVGLAMYGFFSVIQSNLDLAAARAEVARLAAENERSRIARDLHDLLGHSLTTITVKAGLARRLAEHGDHARAAEEITEVEALSRRTLADVRAAVAGHRDVTLTGELATATEVLRASGIIAELPGSVDVVDPELSELFGWVLREAVTNVVRHAHASHCSVLLGPRSIEIRDDGRGAAAGAGNGLTGLRERVAAAGGTVAVGPARPGWRLRVDVPASAATSVPAESVADPAR
jgi:two-component system sensor histidine kinase DesK